MISQKQVEIQNCIGAGRRYLVLLKITGIVEKKELRSACPENTGKELDGGALLF